MVSKSIGIALARYSIGSSPSLAFTSFCVITCVHMYCNLKSYQCIQQNNVGTLKNYRDTLLFVVTGLVFSEYLLSGQAPPLKEINDDEPLFPAIPSLNMKSASQVKSLELMTQFNNEVTSWHRGKQNGPRYVTRYCCKKAESLGLSRPPNVKRLTDEFSHVSVNRVFNTYRASNIKSMKNGSYTNIVLNKTLDLQNHKNPFYQFISCNANGDGFLSENTYYYGFCSALLELLAVLKTDNVTLVLLQVGMPGTELLVVRTTVAIVLYPCDFSNKLKNHEKQGLAEVIKIILQAVTSTSWRKIVVF
ncbi:hypothetical protein ACFE04_019475 [Oxalis oulophora]